MQAEPRQRRWDSVPGALDARGQGHRPGLAPEHGTTGPTWRIAILDIAPTSPWIRCPTQWPPMAGRA
ncbi:MAG TPA: hypothetical protein PKK84_07285, partial [Armatimonadota bacterium]|nr:hypothetical protein [Armatimonadota bacterium]